MVCAFRGWNDAGDAASTAAAFVSSALAAERFAQIDAEEFYDFQSHRPSIRLTDGQAREIVWPSVEVFEAAVPRAPRDLVLVQGAEPSMRWRAFTALLIDLAEALGVQLVVTLGSLLGEVPHSHPVSITGFASDPAVMDRLGLQRSSYEGPTGIVGVLHSACAEAGISSASLWASIPHYVAAATNPKAALALVRKLETVVEVSVDASELEQAADDYERQVGMAVRSDPEIQAYVERVEREAESGEPLGPQDLPSGDLLAKEFQRFLRQRGGESN